MDEKPEPAAPRDLAAVVITFTRSHGAPEDVSALRAVLAAAPGYPHAVRGGPFGPEEADSVFRDPPPGTDEDGAR